MIPLGRRDSIWVAGNWPRKGQVTVLRVRVPSRSVVRMEMDNADISFWDKTILPVKDVREEPIAGAPKKLVALEEVEIQAAYDPSHYQALLDEFGKAEQKLVFWLPIFMFSPRGEALVRVPGEYTIKNVKHVPDGFTEGKMPEQVITIEVVKTG